MIPATRVGRATRRPRSIRVSHLLVAAAIVILAACGKKGPPLAPFVRVPAAVTTVTPQRVGDDVYLSFAVPSTNADGQKPADIGSLEVYAVTADRAPATERQRDVATLIATLPVRPILPEPPPPPDGAPTPPPIPLPPGVDQGSAIAVKETLTADVRVPIELPVERPLIPVGPATDEEAVPFGPLVAPPPSMLPHRHYFVVAISPRGRKSVPSAPVAAPLDAGSSAPGAPAITNTATEMRITWTAPPDARASTILLPPTVKPVPAGANATPANATPVRVPTPLAPLTAKSLGFNSQATTYNVYEVLPAPAEVEPFSTKLPAPMTPAPLQDTEFVVKGVSFGVERCFEVRPVDQIFGATVIGPASPRTCFTAADTFPPVAPKSLAAIAGAGVINLIWDANTEPDVAGYIVLRGEAPGDTLQPITKEPVTVASYRDDTVRVGTRYVYAVIAVDRATPPNASPQSNRAEETARQ